MGAALMMTIMTTKVGFGLINQFALLPFCLRCCDGRGRRLRLGAALKLAGAVQNLPEPHCTRRSLKRVAKR